MQAAVDTIAEGVRQCDAAANVYHAQISGTKEYGGDYASIVPLMPSGIRTSTPHLSWTDEPYRNGDTVLVELAGCYRRYHCPLSRTVIVGDAPQKVKDLAAVVVEGIANTLAAIKPGITCEEVERAWAGSIAKSGFIKDSRVGYSMGLNYPPDWGEHTASLRPGDKTVMQPNMTFHFMPGIWLEDCGVDISESIRITENGVETFTNYPRKLLVK
jgi:ectoine hydrolase